MVPLISWPLVGSTSRLSLVIFAGAPAVVFAFSHPVVAKKTTPASEVLTLTLKTGLANTNGFILDLKNSEPFEFVKVTGGAFDGSNNGFEDPDDSKQGAVFFEQKADTPSLPLGTEVTVSVKIKSKDNDFTLTRVTWENVGGFQQPQPLNNVTYTVTPVGDPMNDFTLTNDSNYFVTFIDLTALANVGELDQATQIRVLPGFSLFDSLVSLLPTPRRRICSFPMWIGEITSTSRARHSTVMLWEINCPTKLILNFGHQAPVPEPPTRMLLGMGVAILGISAQSVERATWC